MSTNGHWTATNIPDQTGKVIVITGANSGLGYEATRLLAQKGAEVIMACRNSDKATQARNEILQQLPNATVHAMRLDLSSLDSIGAFATALHKNYDRLHILMNNAGVMATPYRKTADGFELQFGTNHLGHYALTGLLLDLLLPVPDSRIVTLSSTAVEIGRMHFDDLMFEKGSYSRWAAYGQSKLANLLFAQELQRRLSAKGYTTRSLAAHPGFASTNLQHAGFQMDGGGQQYGLMRFLLRFAHTPEIGVLSQLFAATSPDAAGGAYYGPDGFAQMRGYPHAVQPMINRSWRDTPTAQRLWQISESLTGITYQALA